MPSGGAHRVEPRLNRESGPVAEHQCVDAVTEVQSVSSGCLHRHVPSGWWGCGQMRPAGACSTAIRVLASPDRSGAQYRFS